MKITKIRSMRMWGPRVHSVGGETGWMMARIIVRVDTDAGLYGLGEVDKFFGVREALSYMDGYLQGRDVFTAPHLVHELMYGTVPPHPAGSRQGVLPGDMMACRPSSPTATPWGPVVWAASGVEMALLDIMGKALGVPVYNLLGGRVRDRVKIYLDRSSPPDPTDLNAWKDMARASIDEGFTQLKFDIDYLAPDAQEDVWNRSLTLGQMHRMVERLQAVRDAAGPDLELCADFHRQYGAPDSIRLARMLEPLNLLWLEDPTPHFGNPDVCADFRRHCAVPLCVGEMLIAEQFRLFVDHAACDILHPDIIFCGGLHEMRRIAEYAELHDLPFAIHGNGGSLAAIAAAHVAAACRNFLGLEYHFIETDWVNNFVRREVPLFENGYLPLPEVPGLGVELNEEICRQYLAPGEEYLG